MLFLGRFGLCAFAVAALLAVNGCSPSEQSQLDEEKEPHFVLGKSRVNSMDYSGAIEAFGESLEVNPRSAAAHFQLACLFDTKASDPAAAIYHYQEFLRLNPKAENAEVIKQRVYSCKQQLAADVLPLPSAPAAQQQLERLIEKNRQLQQQLDGLQELVKQLSALTNSQPLAATSPSPDDVSAQPATTAHPATARNSHPAVSQPVTRPKPRIHTVAAGETLTAIARKSGVSLAALQAANPGVSPKKMKVGQVLNLPAP
jgi:LysM repeat protein